MKRSLLTLTLLFSATAGAQQPLVLLDPARGGSENGAHVADRVDEKTVTLNMAVRLGSLLRARGFAVEMTRDSDTDVPGDARAALANTTHPIACILLHATGSGTGVHLYTTTLKQTPATNGPALWDEAQAFYADRSRALASEMGTAYQRSKIPVAAGQTWMRPLDNMQCPAVAVEVAPKKDGTTADDSTYQAHVLDVIAGAMLFWRGRVAALTPAPPPTPAPAQLPAQPQPATAAPPTPKPAVHATPSPAAATSAAPAKSTVQVKTATAGIKPAVTPTAKPAAQATPKPTAPKPSPATVTGGVR